MTTIKEQEKYYNLRWRDFRFANSLKLSRSIAILEGILATGILEPRMIDLGCGSGWLTSMIGMFGPTLGVELSGDAVAESTSKFPNCKFIQADILNWDYPKGEYDIVVSQEVLEHFLLQDEYLEICYELLREGGYLILTTPNRQTFYAMPDNQRSSWSSQPVENLVTISELRKLIEKRFDVVSLKTLIPGYGRKGIYRFINSLHFRNILRKTHLLTYYESVVLEMGFGLHSFVLCQKPYK